MIDNLVTLAVSAGMTRTYPMGKVPPTPSYPYAVVGIPAGDPVNRRLGGGTNRKSWRFTVQIFARSADTVTEYAAKADAAFEDKVLSVLPGNPFSMRELQSSDRDPDANGVLYILHTYKILEA